MGFRQSCVGLEKAGFLPWICDSYGKPAPSFFPGPLGTPLPVAVLHPCSSLHHVPQAPGGGMAKKNQVTKPSFVPSPFKDQESCNLLSKSRTNFQISPTFFYCLWLVSYSGTSYSVLIKNISFCSYSLFYHVFFTYHSTVWMFQHYFTFP